MTDPTSHLTIALEGRYTVERELGAGGMATVYLALDLKHDRKVALKVLKPELAAVVGSERFLAEIRTTANLQHPHILPLFDSGEADGFLFFVMPYVEGESLRDRLDREGELPVKEAVRIATAVASALDYAHRHGVIHRDIKPANILLHDGQPLVADFGIALAVSAAGGGRLTETGLSLGTPYYMSPEQATAERDPDPRSDVYALGCVLYEMLVGEPPYTGATAQAVLGKILTTEPVRPTEHRRTIPAHVEAAVLMALEKRPADRFGSAAEFAAALNSGLAHPSRVASRSSSAASPNRYFRALALAAYAAIVTLVAFFAVSMRKSTEDPPQFIPVAFDVPFRARNSWGTTALISPDGQSIAYYVEGYTYRVLSLATGEVKPITSTPHEVLHADFAPSSDSLVVRTTGWMGQLMVVSLLTNQARMVADSAHSYAAWGEDGWIYFTDLEQGIHRVRPDGSSRESVVTPRNGGSRWMARNVEPLPGGRGLLYARLPWLSTDPAKAEIVAFDFDTGQERVLLTGVQATFVPPHYLVVVQADGTAIAGRFNPDRGVPDGEFKRVLDGVEFMGGWSLRASFSVTADGHMVFVKAGNADPDEIVVLDRSGRQVGEIAGWPGWVDDVGTSSTGGTVVASVGVPGRGVVDLWVRSEAMEAPRRLTFGEVVDYYPTFVTGQEVVAFVAPKAGRNWDLYFTRTDGSGQPWVVLDRPGEIVDPAFSPDGRWLAYCERDAQGQVDLRIHTLDGDSANVPVAESPYRECGPAIAPDGRWLAYESDETGRTEVYVVPMPVGATSRIQVTTEGARNPTWSEDGRELFYYSPDNTIVAVPVMPDTTFTFGRPEPLFDAGELEWSGVATGNGQRFLMVKRNLHAPGSVVLVRNWVRFLERELDGGD